MVANICATIWFRKCWRKKIIKFEATVGRGKKGTYLFAQNLFEVALAIRSPYREEVRA